MVTTKKDAIDLQNQIDKLSKDFDAGPFAHDLQHHPGKRGPNDLEQRIEDLMAKVDAGEIQLEDLTPEDRQVIIDIRMQNESGDNLK